MNTKIVTIDLDARAYDIYIGTGLLYRISDYIPEDIDGRSIFIVCDANVQNYAGKIRDILRENGARISEVYVLPSGERTKSFKEAEKLCEWLLANGANRNSYVVAVGGGVVGDLAGFCASIIMRGVPYIQVPTTLLAQVDSAVGGKTAVNTALGKNMIGSFYQPEAVITDLETLKTLPERELLAGYAEIVKYGLINDAGFFSWLEENGKDVCALDLEALAYAIEASCKAKATIVEADEREAGQRALLNLGHTFGHALEAAAGYNAKLLHGEAVAIGTVMAFDLSVRLGYCSQEDKERVEQHFTDVGLPTHASYIESLNSSVGDLMDLIARDKKMISDRFTFILTDGIGRAFIANDVPEKEVRAVLSDALGGDIIGKKGRWKSAFSSLSLRSSS